MAASRESAVSPETLSHAGLFQLARRQVLTGRSLVESGANAVEDLARRIAMHEASLGDPITDFTVMRFGADASPEHIAFFRGIQDDVASHVGELCAIVAEYPNADKRLYKSRLEVGLLSDSSLVVDAWPYPGRGVRAKLFLPVSVCTTSESRGSIVLINTASPASRTFTTGNEMRIDLGGTTVAGDKSLDVSCPYLTQGSTTIIRRIMIGDDSVGKLYNVAGSPSSDTSSALKERLETALHTTFKGYTASPEAALP